MYVMVIMKEQIVILAKNLTKMEETKTEISGIETLPEAKNWLKEIGTTIPIISLFVAFLGIIKTYLFYNHFKIEIGNYIGLSELTSLIIYDIVRILPYTITVALMFTGGEKIITNFKKKADKKVDEKKKVNTPKKVDENELVNNIALILGLLFIVALLAYFIYLITKSSSIMVIPMFFLMIASIFIGIKIPHLALLMQILFVGLVLLLFGFLEFEIYDIEHKKYLGTVISTKDNTYITSDSSYYVGKTASFVFIHNKYDSSNTIIPAEEIKLMKIKINEKKK